MPLTKDSMKQPAPVKPTTQAATVPASLPPDRAFDLAHPIAPDPIANSEFSKKAWPEVKSWLQTTSSPKKQLPAGFNAYGDELVSNGAADPDAYTKSQMPERNNPNDAGEKVSRPLADVQPTPPLQRMFLPSNPAGINPDGSKMSEEEYLKSSTFDTQKDFEKSWVTATDVVNDTNLRGANLRRWAVDDPMVADDSPALEYQGKSGKWFKGPGPKGDQGDLIDYWKLKDKSIVTTEDIEFAYKPENRVTDSQGNVVGYRLPNDKVVPLAYLDDGAFEQAYRAFPDGTVFALPDGSIPPDMQNIATKQVDPGFLNMGISNPRAPWQSKSGDTIFDKSFWDRVGEDDRPVKNVGDAVVNAIDNVHDTWGEQSAIGEALPYITDIGLSSAPYLFNPAYAAASALSAATPYAYGFDGDTVQPTGRGLDNLDQLGVAKYAKGDLTNSQRYAGMISPIFNAYVERMSGKTIGGFENIFPEGSALRKAFGSTGPGQVAGGMIMEGPVEEGLGVPLSMLEADPLEHVGQESTGVNDITGDIQYDPNSKQWSTLGLNLLNAAGGGAAMGGLFSMKPALKADFNRRTAARAPAQKPQAPIPVNPRRSQAQLDEERRMRSLERTYGEDEER